MNSKWHKYSKENNINTTTKRKKGKNYNVNDKLKRKLIINETDINQHNGSEQIFTNNWYIINIH